MPLGDPLRLVHREREVRRQAAAMNDDDDKSVKNKQEARGSGRFSARSRVGGKLVAKLKGAPAWSQSSEICFGAVGSQGNRVAGR